MGATCKRDKMVRGLVVFLLYLSPDTKQEKLARQVEKIDKESTHLE
jgi:hypothetical protein